MAGWRPVLAAAAGTLLLAGCTSESHSGDGAAGKASPSGSLSASPSASASVADEPYTLSEEQAPKTRADAVAFVRELDVRPDYFGVGYRKREPYESDPATWAVLQDDCLWQRVALPKTVLASLTRTFELPEKAGKGAVYVSLTVTVHTDTVAARRDMARSMESALRCPEQRLNATDVVRGLYSQVEAADEGRAPISDDDLTEVGEWIVDGASEAHTFDWYKYRLGPVTVAATARHGAGRSDDEDSAVSSDLMSGVILVANEIDQTGAGDTASGTPAEAQGAGR
ncbi:hypothetical protein [Streptomyces sp. GbtcB6]|uniref:hypothetical protein n=1 Tax=Streptomyces sp. GbtcB6 TaxID=2824751 RepID=UPI0020C6534D|nr:hypothetical protein [Streptomyces sp. GbtcB6]